MGCAINRSHCLGFVADLKIQTDIAGNMVVELWGIRRLRLSHIDQGRQGSNIQID